MANASEFFEEILESHANEVSILVLVANASELENLLFIREILKGFNPCFSG